MRYGYEYASVILKDEGNMIDVLQVANEPHGSPDYETMNEFARGVRMARDEFSPNTKICSPDCQNTGIDYFNGQALYNAVSKMDTSIYKLVGIEGLGLILALLAPLAIYFILHLFLNSWHYTCMLIKKPRT